MKTKTLLSETKKHLCEAVNELALNFSFGRFFENFFGNSPGSLTQPIS